MENEDLVNTFVPFEIDELDKTTILEEKIFKHVLQVTDPIQRTRLLVDLQEKAKELKVSKSFNQMFKAYQSEQNARFKQKGSNTINFTNPPINDLKCGKWQALDTGIKRTQLNNFEAQTVIACPHPILPVERLINVENGLEKVKLAFYKDQKWQYVVVEMNTIASKNKILQLANRGISVNENNAKELITYIADILELNNIEAKKGISHLGWIGNDFVPFSADYSLDVDTEFKQKLNSIREKGSYDDWKTFIKELRKSSKTLRFMMASSLASVLVSKFNINTFIVHVWGKSSNGKTVAEMVSESIWGNPDNNLCSNLSNTFIANERLCNFFRNMPVFLDELQLAKTKYKSFDEFIYTFTEGKGKERGNVDNGIRETTEWQTIIMLTGEEPLTSQTSKEGVKNRVIEINEEKSLLGNKTGNEIVTFIRENHGFAGKEFVEYVQKNFNEIKEIRNQYLEELNKVVKYSKQSNAMSVVLTADYIFSKYLLDDELLSIEDITEYFTEDTDEADRYFEIILNWFFQNKNKFLNKDDNNQLNNEIWGKYELYGEDLLFFYVNQKVLCDFLDKVDSQGVKFAGIKKKLADKGYIERTSQGKFIHNTSVGGIKQPLIKFNAKAASKVTNEDDIF